MLYYYNMNLITANTSNITHKLQIIYNQDLRAQRIVEANCSLFIRRHKVEQRVYNKVWLRIRPIIDAILNDEPYET